MRSLLLAFMLLVVAFPFTKDVTRAASLPADMCSLLTPAQLQKTLQQPFGGPIKSTATPAYSGQPAGTHCEYRSQSRPPRTVILIVYVDRSAPEARQTFEKLSAFYPANSKPSGIGDSAYIDKDHAIHVLKNNVRYYISIGASNLTPENEKQLKDLSMAVATQI